MKLDLECLDSATKYPSIPTYHTLDGRGGLLEEHIEFDGPTLLTEKINGVNGRIIVVPGGDWYIGSRKEILTVRGDRVPNKALGIVEALRPIAERLSDQGSDKIVVYYLEVFGAGIGPAAKQYSGETNVSARLFDLAWVSLDIPLNWKREAIAAWRDGGGQAWSTEYVLNRAAEVEGIELTPRLGIVPGDELTDTVEETHKWLTAMLPTTHAALDSAARGRPEGIVLRTDGRGTIAKVKLQDYEKTLLRRAEAARAERKQTAAAARA